jgi:hypothetical protein
MDTDCRGIDSYFKTALQIAAIETKLENPRLSKNKVDALRGALHAQQRALLRIGNSADI